MKLSIFVGLVPLLAGHLATAASVTNRFPLKSTPGVFKGINWVNVTAFSQGQGFTGSVAPASGKTYGDLTTDPSGNSGASPAVMAANYAGSKTKSFALESFYGACTTYTKEIVSGTARPGVFPAENCTWTVYGYKKSHGSFPLAGAKPDASATFMYIPGNNDATSPPANMSRFILSSAFKGLKLVQFYYEGTAVNHYDEGSNTFYQYEDGSTVALLDNVVYTTTAA